VAPGLTALTRILRSRNSLAQVRANDRSAALIAAYTPMPSLPLAFVFDEFRMIDPPSFSNGRGSEFAAKVLDVPSSRVVY
jgi:hypothetical protein